MPPAAAIISLFGDAELDQARGVAFAENDARRLPPADIGVSTTSLEIRRPLASVLPKARAGNRCWRSEAGLDMEEILDLPSALGARRSQGFRPGGVQFHPAMPGGIFPYTAPLPLTVWAMIHGRRRVFRSPGFG